uniref:SUEL-type lectin domain-containing protein n=1 Tax=Acanthochromis polyacanthus TaxID=80966 RepID=A0A3Q1EYQ9_9TELE
MLSDLFPLSFSNSSSSSGYGRVLSVHRANYGRHDRTTCSSGRPASQIQNFGDPCLGTYKYLDVTYTCNVYSVTCEGSVAHLKCGKIQYVLNIHRADYGRSDRNTCISGRPAHQTQNTCCSRPTGKVAQRYRF